MENREQLVYEKIVERCRSLRDGKFIRSIENINRLLQTIIKNEESFEYLKKCNEMYGYGNVLNSAVEEKKFVMPINNHKVIVLVTGLLRQFLIYESHQTSSSIEGLDFYRFLTRYYPSIDIDKSFALFVDAVIFPYSKAFKGMIEEEDGVELDVDKDVEWMDKLNDNVKEQLYPFITTLSEHILADNGIIEKQKREYLIMIEGFNYVLELGNTKLINVVFIGLKNTLQGYKNGASYLKDIEDILTNYHTI